LNLLTQTRRPVVVAEKALRYKMDLQSMSEKKSEWAKNHSSLCFFPWNTIEVRSSDVRRSVKPNNLLHSTCCCNLTVSKTEPINSSDPFEEIKKEMDSGFLPVSCHACYREEKNGGVSERVRDIMGKSLEELEEFAQTRKTKYFELRINFSKICTLACRSCEASSSSTFAKITKDNSTDYFEIDIVDNEDYYNQIQEVIHKNINFSGRFYLHLMGGEPMLSKGAMQLLDWVAENNYSNKMCLRITTSGSYIPDRRHLEQLDKFQRVEFIFSIDSIGENYTYVRWPVKFSKIENNLQELREFKKSNFPPEEKNWDFILAPVFSLNNIFYLKDYLDYWHEYFISHKDDVFTYYFTNTTLLYRTNYLDIQALPIKYRSNLKTILQECLNHRLLADYQEVMIHLYNFLKTTLAELDQWNDNLRLWNLYLKHTAEFDLRTNTKFEILNSRLYDLLEQEDIDLYKHKLTTVDTSRIMIIK
jgi:organic radical activating enzyme